MSCFRVSADGNVSAASVDEGNPVKIGGRYNTTLPTLTNGQRGDAQLDVNGNMRVLAVGGVQTGADGVLNTSLFSLLANVNQTSALRPMAVSGFVFNGTSWDRAKGNAADGTVVSPYGLRANDWSFASGASGIVNTTTAVTIKAAAGAGIKNYIRSMQIDHDTLGAATELVIRSGAAGTVIWRAKLKTTALPITTINFDPPLQSAANTLLEVCTLTATTTGGVYVNVQGHTGA